MLAPINGADSNSVLTPVASRFTEVRQLGSRDSFWSYRFSARYMLEATDWRRIAGELMR
jgi:hypothetical protein